MTNMPARKRILEVGCGPGKHSLMLAKTFLSIGSVLVSCDISKGMVQAIKQNYENPQEDFSLVPGNKFAVDVETDFTEIGENGMLNH